MTTTLKAIGAVLNKNSPTILTGIAVTGLITTVLMGIQATPKAVLLMEKANKGNPDRLVTKEDLVKIIFKCYWPTAVLGSATIACIISANSVSTRRYAALMSLYSITETGLREYQNKVAQVVGTKKEEYIRDEIAGEKLISNPPRDKMIISTGLGDTLCYDSISGRYFTSCKETIRKAENDFNQHLMSEMFVSLNEFYWSIGLEGIAYGGDMGWHAEKGLLEIEYSSKLTSDGVPCLVLNYKLKPKEYK